MVRLLLAVVLFRDGPRYQLPNLATFSGSTAGFAVGEVSLDASTRQPRAGWSRFACLREGKVMRREMRGEGDEAIRCVICFTWSERAYLQNGAVISDRGNGGTIVANQRAVPFGIKCHYWYT